MKHIIKNFDDLATDQYKKDTLEIVEAALEAIDTRNVLKENLILKSDILYVKGNEYNLKEYENIYVVGFGKVSVKAASVLEEILGDRIKSGAVVGISDEKVCNIIETYKGTHPKPSEQNVVASSRIAEISLKATNRDLVLVIVGGGGSSLLCGEGELEQGRKLYTDFLKTGGSIKELNILRKHISDLKGGGLAKKLYPATVIGLVFSDVPGDDCAVVASGPTFKEESTIEDAEKILKDAGLSGFELSETPKDDRYFSNIENVLIASNNTALVAMDKKARELGYEVNNLGAEIYLPQKDTAKLFRKKSKKGFVNIAGGETKLVVPTTCHGKGGRNDSMALNMLDYIKKNQIFVSFASDGHDNTDAAGCIIDHNTKKNIKKAGMKIKDYAKCLNTYPLFEKTGNLIFTGYLESNVSDLMVSLTHK